MEKIESRYQRRVLVLAYALLGLLALLPLFCMGENLVEAEKKPFSNVLEGYDPTDRWAGMCQDIDFPSSDLGDEHEICGLPKPAAAPIRLASSGDDIRFDRRDEPALPPGPVVDHWEDSHLGLPVVVAAAPAGGGGGGFAIQSISGGGGGFLLLAFDDSDSSGSGFGGGGPLGDPDPDPPFEEPNPDPDPEDPSVPEPSAGVLFALGFAAVLRQRNAARR